MNTKFEDSRKYKRLLAVIFLALAFGILATNVIAEQEEIASATFTYYVDAAVSASGDGLTPATAFKTLAEAQNAVWVHPDASAIFEIYIAPGVYEEDGLIFGKSVHLHGAGAGATVIDASQPRSNPEQTGIYNGNALYFGGAELSFLVEDLTIVGRQHINPDADPEFLQPFEAIYVYSTRHTIATLRRVKIFDCGRGIFAWGGLGIFPPFGDSGPVIIQNSIFDNNGGAIHVQYNGFAPYDGGGMPHAIVENSVIANSGEYGFFNSDPLHTLRNNIFINNAEAFRTAFHPDEDRQMTLSHNLFWGNGSDYDNPNGVISSVGELHSDSLLSEDGFFYPSPASPVIDTGDPNAIYKDQDGSRNDMGIYGGPHAPGVRMKLTPASANVNNGDSISMTLTIENVGDLAQNMMITVTLPSQTISPTIAATGVISDSNIYFSLGDVFRTETVTFTVTADIEQPDVLLFSYSATYQKAERVQQQEGTVNVIVNALQSFLSVVTR